MHGGAAEALTQPPSRNKLIEVSGMTLEPPGALWPGQRI